MSHPPRVLMVANPQPEHVGAHLHRAAQSIGVVTQLLDVRDAFRGLAWKQRLLWRLAGRRPQRLAAFGQRVVAAARELRPDYVLATGIAPLDAQSLDRLRQMGIPSINFLTDDPWNPVHRAPWFMRALPRYDRVFSPRRANLEDLGSHGCPRVEYLPFAYAPEVHYPEPPAANERARFDADVVFIGGADGDRVPPARALVEAGLRLALYGGYWERIPALRAYARGMADAPTVRKAIGAASVVLCLVRRGNRDGHSMRSFESAAMRGCLLAEDTPEHREIFGPDGTAVRYFRTLSEMTDRCTDLLARRDERARLAQAGHTRVTSQPNTYADRLAAMLDLKRTPTWV